MEKIFSKRILALTLSIAMLLSMVLVFTVSGSAADAKGSYLLNVGTVKAFAEGKKDDGEYVKGGTDDYFTLIYSSKTKVEDNSKTFTADGFIASRRIAWGAKSQVGENFLNVIQIKTRGAATVKIWWASGGAGRYPTIYNADGTVHAADEVSVAQNALHISELQISAAGTYYIGNQSGSNYFYQIQVVDSGYNSPAPQRAEWSTVAAPVITSATDNKDGSVTVNVSGLIGNDGADELLVSMYSGNKLIKTKGAVIEKSTHSLTFYPEDSGVYSFKAELLRAKETTKVSETKDTTFVYKLKAPNLKSATSKGDGKVELIWGTAHEAEKYAVYQDGVKIGETTSLAYLAEGLNIDQEYSFQVSAIRAGEEVKSNALAVVASKDAKIAWAFTVYGPSTDTKTNKFTGSVNDDGYVTVESTGGKGKIQPTSVDGLALYYTAIPTTYNFTLSAKVTINEWTLSNAQEGFGLMALDRIPEADDDYNFWNNSYLAGSTKIEYKYDAENDQILDNKVLSYDGKYSMKLGIGSIERIGVTADNLPFFGDSDTATINANFKTSYYPLETHAADRSLESGTYNIIGNYKGDAPVGTLEDKYIITEYIMEIQRNNSGYRISHYNAKTGELVRQVQYWYPDALDKIDSNFVYVGFFASRNCKATFSDVELTTILPSEDAPREYPPTTYVSPNLTVNSASVTTNGSYEFIADPNVAGTLSVSYNGRTIITDKYLLAGERFRVTFSLDSYEDNNVRCEFTPDPDQELPDFTALGSTKKMIINHEITFNRGNYHKKTFYISPDAVYGDVFADGSREHPFDLQFALDNAAPGQTFYLMEGTYKPGAALKIQRGMDGTEEHPIRLMADPEAKTRPVIDFEKLWSGFTTGGDYWYFYGFDVTGSANMQKGFQVSGNYNVLDQINAYENGNTGIQICRLSGSDLMPDWPHDNLILNCTSYRNYDSGFEDADGFAAKLTVGEGNVFDGCIAYNNADDGWDLYAKAETGSIGAVTIRNCVSYANGFVPGAGAKTGNGNGFKMGGESLSGKHVIENSIAFNNLMKGIDCNSCPDITVKDCISFNNGSYNYAFYTNNAENTAFVATGAISFRTDAMGKDLLKQDDNLKDKGTQKVADFINATTYYWDADSGKCLNTAGDEITADMFVSLTCPVMTENKDKDGNVFYVAFQRNADGSINMQGFLEVKDSVPENAAGCKLGGAASYDMKPEADEQCTFSDAYYTLENQAHWHYCECGNRIGIEAHDFITIIDKKQEGDQTGLKHDECLTCGYKKAAITIYPTQKPAEPPVEDPGTVDTPTEDLGFFARIWLAIINFFRRLFGLEPK